MFAESILLTISEIAVALVGFSGIVVAFGRRGGGDWTPTELLQLRTLVEPSLFALFASLVPSTIQLVSPSEALTWRLTGAVFGMFEIIALVLFLRRTRAAEITTGQWILTFGAFSIAGALWLAAFDVIPWQPLICVLGLIHALLVGAYNFTLLIFRVGRD